jgi:hypothetical protein
MVSLRRCIQQTQLTLCLAISKSSPLYGGASRRDIHNPRWWSTRRRRIRTRWST